MIDLVTSIASQLFLERELDVRDMGVIHPSSLGKCDRRVAYEMFGVVPTVPMSANSLYIFDIGTALHKWWQERFVRMGILDPKEVEILVEDKYYRVQGHADGILTLTEGRKLLEIKTIGQKGFLKLKRPMPDHIVQVQTYMHFLKLDSAILIYLCKDYPRNNYNEFTLNSLPILVFEVAYNQIKAEGILRRIDYILDCIDSFELPERGGKVTRYWADYDCRFCPYVGKCQPYWEDWMENEARKESLNG